MSTRLLFAAVVATALVACQSTDPAPAEPIDWEAATEAFIANGTPGPGHAVLEPMIGHFAATTTVFMPDMPPEVTNGTCRNEWSLDGRFVETHYEGSMMGMPFTGRGFMGHDNATGEYVSVWLDSMTTSIMPVARGTASADGRTITSYLSMPNFMTGEMETMREVTTIHGPDHHTFEMFVTPEGGTEEPSLHIDYVRL